ncbi:MAG: DUF4136 domain-containing protein [Vicinamibacterales bacterium]
MRLATLVAVVGLLLGTAASAQSISFDFDRSVSFGGFRTYAWASGTNVPDALVHQRIVNAVDAQLARKGLSRVDAGARPDVLVAYHATFDKDLQISGFGSGWGGYRFGGYRNMSARAEEILVGTMIVDLVDPGTKTIVWRGTATKDIDVNAKPEKRDKNINKTAEKLFKHYPPQ